MIAPVAILVALPVHAQTVADAGNTYPADIVVTAQRRAERLTDVPISITALSGDQLASAGVREARDLSSVVPGLNFATNGAFAQPTVRGIGTTVSSAGSDANVAIYIDGVYQPNQIGNFADLVDLEQVEVLKGPQGTLFGRNATGGAIRVTTARPSFQPTGKMSLSYGRFDEVRGTAYGSAGLSDTVAASFGFLYADDNGYTRNIGTGNRVASINSLQLRGKLLYAPSDNVEFVLSGARAESHSNAAFSLGVLNGNSTFVNTAGSIPAAGPRQVSLTFDPKIDASSNTVSLSGKIDLDFATLSTLTSYQKTKTFLITDVDRTNRALIRSDLPGVQKTFTQELNLVSNGNSAFKWFLGAFYYHDDADGSVIVNQAPLFTETRLRSEAFAPFGEVNLTLGQLTLIGGLRYNHERKRFTATRGPLVENRAQTFTNLTPRIGARFVIDRATNVYATWSKGFKSGLFDQLLVGSAINVFTVEPEKVDAWEAGFKHGQGRSRFSAAVFHYSYDNIQFQAFNPNAGGLTQIFNAAKAEIHGGEAEFATRIGDSLNIRAALAYTHARYKSFPNANIYCPRGAPGFGNALIPLGAVNPCTGGVNTGADGNKMIRTPEFTASLAGDYRIPLPDGAIDLNASAFYSGTFFWDPGNRLKEGAYVLVNAEVGYTLPGDKLRLALWGRNLANELYSLYVPESGAGDSVAYARPRSYGVSARLSF